MILIMALKYIKLFENYNLAPNGKKSNLTTELYHLVRTAQFKKWFGDWENEPENASKVVDENGEPMVVLHGGDRVIEFSSERLIFSTNNSEVAKYFGNYNKYFMNIKNPFIIDSGSYTWDRIHEDVLLSKLGKETFIKMVNKEYKENFTYNEWLEYVNEVEALPISIDAVSSYIKNNTNYDGVIAFNIEETTSYIVSDDYICFEPNQIKSVDNNGDFSNSSNNINENILKTFEKFNNKEERSYFKKYGKIYRVGDIIHGSQLDELSGDTVGNDNNEYILVQQDLSIFPYTRKDLFDLDLEDVDDEIFRIESIKENFEDTPPIPQEGDGMHRIIAAKELGYKTILMWKKIT
jgi:hypothetical protein